MSCPVPRLLLLLLLLPLASRHVGVVRGQRPPGRACVVTDTERSCRDISATCAALGCGAGLVCTLMPSGAAACLPDTVRSYENCGPERQRLSQPCPAGVDVLGFGEGCTFCRGGGSVRLAPIPPAPPAPPSRGGTRTEPQPPSPPTTQRACVVRHIGGGEFKKECLDIATLCEQKKCPRGAVCGLDLDEQLQCFPQSVKEFENCGPDLFRLSQPCPADAGLRGFGMGCTFCKGSFSGFDPESTVALAVNGGSAREGRAGPQPPSPPPVTERACVVRHIGSGEFKKACFDISTRCGQRRCPQGTVCGLDLNERIQCFPNSVKEFQSCGPDFFRLSQPCPADSGILGFGMGCNYCIGGNPFQRGPEPPAGPPFGEVLEKEVPRPPSPPPQSGLACIVRHIGNGEFKKACEDISNRCRQRQCPPNTVCGLDLDERIQCFSQSVKKFENCGSDSFRLSQPCPADSGIRGFGMGCTFCAGGNPFLPGPPAVPSRLRRLTDGQHFIPEETKKACVVLHNGSGESTGKCLDISAQCKRQNCTQNQVCGLDLNEEVQCFAESVKEFENCGPDSFRLSQPCPADSGIRGFGMGCTFCVGGNPFEPVGPPVPVPTSPIPTSSPTTSAPTGPLAGPSQRACLVTPTRRECVDISSLCGQRGCPADTVCGMDLDGELQCLPQSAREFTNCGPESLRLSQPCPADAGIRAFGMGCTFCEGGNPFVEPEPPALAPTDSLACVSRITRDGSLRRGCLDLSELCRKRGCPADRTCALDADEQPNCFASSQLPVRHCGPARQRVAQPCPDGTEVVAFGAGCTFCRPAAATPDQSAAGPRRACLVSGPRRRCQDIAARCGPLRCAETELCALTPDDEARCFSTALLTVANCGSERRRLDQPCPAGLRAVAFGAGCTYCGRG